MAMRRFRSFRRRRPSGRRLLRWAGSQTDAVTTATDDEFFLGANFNRHDLVDPAQTYQQNTLLEQKGATVQRIRGWIDINFGTTDNANISTIVVAEIMMGIVCLDNEVTLPLTPRPSFLDNFATEDWMWLDHRFIKGTLLGLDATSQVVDSGFAQHPHDFGRHSTWGFDIPFDVRSKRKLDGQFVTMVIEVGTIGLAGSSATVDMTTRVWARTLLSGNF